MGSLKGWLGGKMPKYVRCEPPIYAVYKGDEFICEGNCYEICEYLGIKLNTFHFYHTNIYKKKVLAGKNRKVIIRIDGKDRIWNEENEEEERERIEKD